MPNKTIEEAKEKILESEPMKRVLGLESTAIITGRADNYTGVTLDKVLDSALQEVYEAGYKEGVEDTLANRPPLKEKDLLTNKQN